MCNKSPSQPQPQPDAPRDHTVRVDRRTALTIHLRERSITYVHIARRLGVSSQRVHAMLAADACPADYRSILIAEFDIPEHLLPRASSGRRGPAPGWLEKRMESARN
mgnify:CR=1 FL=1